MKTIEESFPAPAAPTEPQRPAGAQTTATNPWLYGTIRSVEATREMLFLREPRDDNEQVIRWLPQTRFLYLGAEVKSDALHQGQQISVQFASEAGQRFAKEIDIAAGPPAIGSTAEHRRSLWPSRSGRNARKTPHP